MKIKEVLGLLNRIYWKLLPYFTLRRLYIPLKSIKVNKPIFFIGVQGGGLSVIVRCLKRHPFIVHMRGNKNFWAYQDEISLQTFLPKIPKSLSSFPEGRDKEEEIFGKTAFWWGYATDNLVKKYYVNEKNYVKKEGETFKKIIKNLIRAYAINLKKARFLDKSQIFSLKIRFLNKIFPDAKFILVMRNPYAICWRVASRDYSNSISENLRSLPLEEKVKLAAEHWRNTYKIALRDLEYLKKGLVVKLENFLKNPEKELKRIMEYCELEGNPKDLLPKPTDKFPLGSLNPEKWYPLKKDVNSKYLKELPKKYRDIITKTIGKDLLIKTGYLNGWKINNTSS